MSEKEDVDVESEKGADNQEKKISFTSSEISEEGVLKFLFMH